MPLLIVHSRHGVAGPSRLPCPDLSPSPVRGVRFMAHDLKVMVHAHTKGFLSLFRHRVQGRLAPISEYRVDVLGVVMPCPAPVLEPSPVPSATWPQAPNTPPSHRCPAPLPNAVTHGDRSSYTYGR